MSNSGPLSVPSGQADPTNTRRRTTGWTKSSESGANNANCVEARRHNGLVEVRNSKDPDGASVRYTLEEWAAFLSGVRSGEFDHLLNGG